MAEDWKTSLSERMETYEENAPEGLWQDIVRGMDSSAKRRVIPVWIWTIAAAAAAVAAGVFLFTPLRAPQVGPSDAATTAAAASEDSSSDALTDIKENIVEVIDTGDDKIEIASNSHPTHSQKSKVIKDDSGVLKDISEPSEVIPSDTVASETESSQTAQDSALDNKQEIPSDSQDNTPSVPDIIEWDGVIADETVVKRSGPALSFAISGMMSGSSASENAAFGTSGGGMMVRRSSAASSEYMDLALRNKPTSVKESHGIAIDFGLEIDLAISERLSVGTGLFYSMPESTFKEGTDDNYILTEQYLDNITVPIIVKYDFFRTGAFNFYAKASGSASKFVGYSARTGRYLSGRQLDAEILDKPDLGGVHWGVSGAVGAEVSLTRLFGSSHDYLSLFAEPSLNWYIPSDASDSPIRSIYSAKPLSPGFTGGIRLTVGR